MLLTDQRYHEVRAQTMHELADLIEQAGIKEIITWYGSNGVTALDAQRGIVSMIRNHARKERP